MGKLLYPLIGVPALGAALYAAAITWLWFRQERLLFEPAPLPADEPLFGDPDVREFMVDVPGARLSVAQLKLPQPRGVVFYLHGNSGNLRKWFAGLDAFRELNFDLVMMDYRGYGKSTGRIDSEAQLHADVRAVWNAVAGDYAGRSHRGLRTVAGHRTGRPAVGRAGCRRPAAGPHPADLALQQHARVGRRALSRGCPAACCATRCRRRTMPAR